MGKPENNVKNQKKSPIEAKNNGAPRKKIQLSTTAIAGLSTAALIVLIVLIVGIVHIVTAIKNDSFFDYIDSNLDKYVSFPESDYKDYDLSIDIAKPHDIDVDVAILNLLASAKGEAKNDGALITSAVTIAPGDKVSIWYRGYIIDSNGKKSYKSGMCNFGASAASELEIGSGQFVPGFELDLVGVNTGDYPKFEKITEGEIKETQIAYVTYKRLIEGGNASKDTKTGSCVRIDLSDADIDKTYGTGFRDQLLAAKLGVKAEDTDDKLTFDVVLDGKKHTYSEFYVNFVTECEADPLIVECYFPYDYSDTTLRNQNAYFEVYVDGVVQYECPEFNEEFVKKLVHSEGVTYTEAELKLDIFKNQVLTEAELLEYEGETLTEKYRAYAKKVIDDAYEQNYESMVEDAMWDYYLKKAVIKKYPKVKVDKIHQEYIDDVYYQFGQTGGSIQDQYTGEYKTYETVDEFAIAYLGLTYSTNQDWKSVLYTMSENLVKERLILYYLMQAEDLYPTEEEFATELAKVKQEYIDEYVSQYLEYEKKTREDYTDEEYAKFVEARKAELFDYYDEEYFEETTYYEIALREFRSWAKVSTLDDRTNLPQTK